MLTGRAARGTTWTVLDEWISQWSSQDPDTEEDATRPADGDGPTIGTGRRTHGSKASRSLAR